MADSESELKDLKEKNTELVQKLQYWKMTAAQRENEKLDLMKEINDLRFKLSRLRSGGAAHARKLDSALQSATEETISHLVQASSAVARTLELAKTYMQDHQELDAALPRWSTLSSTPSSEKINVVPPMLIGGRLIQPVVSLSRTLQLNNSRSVNRSPNEQNNNVAERAVPLHMLQDVYIPLTRIDARELPINNRENDMETNRADDSTEDLAMDDSTERITNEVQNLSESEEFDESRRLEAVTEDVEPEDGLTPERSIIDNPLEGPSWLLDRPSSKRKVKISSNFEPDSTTEFEDNAMNEEAGPISSNQTERTPAPAVGVGAGACKFSPTLRRRQRSSPPLPATPRLSASPHFSPRPSRRCSNNGRILKVLVAKMRLDNVFNEVSPPKRSKDDGPPKSQKSNPHLPEVKRQSTEGSPKYQVRDISPSKRLMRFDAPSPNGSTDSRVIVLETKHNQPEPGCSGVSKKRTLKRNNSNDSSRNNSQDDSIPIRQQSDSDSRHQSNKNLNGHRSDSQIRRQTGNDRQSLDSHNNINSEVTITSRDSNSSGSELVSECRTRRPRKAIVYKEKPLNQKLRR